MTANQNPFTPQNPDLDPANNGSLLGSIQFAFKKMMQGINGQLPAQIMRYNRTTNRAQVQILINVVGTDGTQYPRPQVSSIPVLVLGGGDTFLSFPLKAGDLGWILASDRDISLFEQSFKQVAPNTQRMFNFADGMFIPDRMRDFIISGDDTDNVVFGTTDGLVKISLGAMGVRVQAPNVTIIPTPPSIIPMITMGAVSLSEQPPGKLHVHGDLTVSGTITPSIPP